MTTGEYLTGAVFFIVIVGASAAIAAIVVARRGPALTGLARVLAWGLIAALALFLAHLLPGILGVLSRETVACTAVILLAAVVVAVRPAPAGPAAQPPPEPPPSGRLSMFLAWGSVAALLLYVVAHWLTHFDQALIHADTATFHLSNVAAWIDSGSFWQVDDFVVNRFAGNYPQTGDVFTLATILPWSADFLVRFAGVPFIAGLGLAVYSGARELASPVSTALLVAAAVVAMPAVVRVMNLGLADPQMLGLFAVGGYFLLRHWRTGDRFELVLAGVGLGLAMGTRWYALPAVAALVLVWVVAGRITGRPLLRNASILAALILALGGFWLVRNLAESGNPVFPVEFAPFGISIFDAPQDQVRELLGSPLADYLGSPDVLAEIFPSFLDFMGFVAVALWVGIVAAGALALVDLRHRVSGAGRVVALAVSAALIGLAYLFTPYSAVGPPGDPADAWVNARYVVPALAVGAPALAWLIVRGARFRLAAEVLLALAVLDAIRRSADSVDGELAAGGVIAAVALMSAGALAVVAARRVGLEARVRTSRLAAAAAVGVVAIGMVLVGAAIESRHSEKRYVGASDAIDFVNTRAPTGNRIGIVGEGWITYPLFGPQLGNEVVPIAERRDEALRAFASRDRFVEALRRGGYDLVVVQEIDTLEPRRPLRQERWLQDAGFRLVADGNHPGSSSGSRLYAGPDSTFAAEGTDDGD